VHTGFRICIEASDEEDQQYKAYCKVSDTKPLVELAQAWARDHGIKECVLIERERGRERESEGERERERARERERERKRERERERGREREGYRESERHALRALSHRVTCAAFLKPPVRFLPCILLGVC
jgi:hypothetical protein